MFGSLRSVSPQQILKNTELIVAQDRKLTLRLLEHLYEIDRQKLYLEQGVASTFEYCTKHLKLSEPSAARRIRTARCVARYPQLHPLLESGELNLTVVAMVSKYMKAENVDEIIARIKGRSKRAVERIIAEYEPKSALPADRVRMMVVPVKHTAAIPVAPLTTAPPVAAVPAPPATAWPTMRTLSVTAASPIVNAPHVPDQSPAVIAASPQFTVTGDSEKSPNCDITESPAHETVTQPEENAPATAGTITQFERLARVEFTAHEELLSGLEKVRSIASHRLPANAPLEQLIAFMVEYFLDREEPARREDRRETRAAKEGAKIPAELVMRKHIPAQVRDRVLVRDKQCTYVGANGKRCGSTHVLQIDHIKPVARGGASTIDNLRVLCAYHNRLESERLMGKRGPRVELRE